MTEPLLESRIGSVAVLTLNEPAKRNALTPALRLVLVEAIERIERDPTVRAVVLTGGAKAFCAGGDLTAMQSEGLAASRERLRVVHKIVRGIIKSSKPYVAAVEGWAAGAGFSLALCCDTIIAGAGARFLASFPKVGLVADAGLLLTLPNRIGTGKARQILLYAQPIDAEAALHWGVVDEVVADGAALERAIARASELDDLAPLSAAFTKEFFARGVDEALDWERSAQSALLQTGDHAEGKSAFFEKRRPVFRNC